MKTAADTAASRRSQPMRQTRTNPSRTTGHSRSGPGRDTNTGPSPDQPINIFPAITHFTDGITALPKELVRHFTLLKEVDAKICAPEEHLHKLVEACLNSPYPQPTATATANDNPSATSSTDGAGTQNTINGVTLDHNVQPLPVTDESYRASVYSEENMPRRQLFLATAQHVKEMLISLEEKNHVISTANEALQRQLSRIEDVWPHLENEFSEEARYGSTTHWAYPENRVGKPVQNDRGRHGALPNLTSAAQQLAEEAAARSESRKQAVQAKKAAKTQPGHQESDFDDHDKQKGGDTKKPHSSSKVRKTADTSAPVGLGISAGGPTNGNPPAKRRKVERPAAGQGAPERAMAKAIANTPSQTKSTVSPRATPAPEGPKKRKALPMGSTQNKKSRNGVGTSSVTSSPVLGAFPENKAPAARNSPGPTATPRPASSRARQNSAQSGGENGKPRPSSSTSNKPNGVVPATPDPAPPASLPRSAAEPKPPKEPSNLSKVENSNKKDAEPAESGNSVSAVQPPKKEKEPVKAEEVVAEKKSEPVPPTPATVSTTVTTKSGRASKPSTPALSTFQDAARSRAARANDTITAKRSHKKGAGMAAQAIAAKAAADDDANSSLQGDEEEGDIDADEPTYCYCNSVSYGAMVACDADDCQREWFHLECVGLKVAPKQNVKWYCDDCKERLRVGGKKINGR